MPFSTLKLVINQQSMKHACIKHKDIIMFYFRMLRKTFEYVQRNSSNEWSNTIGDKV